MAITIAVANQKGGVGKTTSSIELAACFVNRGHKTLVVDLEQQMDTTKYCGGNPNTPGVYEILKGDAKAVDVIQHVAEFDLLAASPSLSKADDEFAQPTDVLKLKKALREVNEKLDYDFIVIDTNPGRNRLLNMAYIAADYVVIPSDTDDGSVDGILSVFRDLDEYKEAEWSYAEVIGVIFTRYENTSMHRYQADVIKSILDEKAPDAFLMRIRKGIAASEAKSEGLSMQKGKKFANPAMDYRRVADKIIYIATHQVEGE